MKIRPYRVCDICGNQYDKTHNCMKVKILNDPMRNKEYYGDLRIMETMDICPRCGKILLYEVSERVKKKARH